MKAFKFRHRVTRTRVKVGKLPEFERLQRPLWIRRVLVRAQEGQYGRRKRGRFSYGLGLSTRVREGNAHREQRWAFVGGRPEVPVAEWEHDHPSPAADARV